MPWLAASPDGIVYDSSEELYKRGCLKVKCPISCKSMPFDEACKQMPSFCLHLYNAKMPLSKSHAYYYQVQTQVHCSQVLWCDFVVWSPIQTVCYESRLFNALAPLHSYRIIH